MEIKGKIFNGIRCNTYIIEEDGKDVIYQEYKGGSYYQAKKKYDILNKISKYANTEYIPKCYKYIELKDKAVLYTEYKNAKSLKEIRKLKTNFSISNIAKELCETLYKVHSIKDSDYFGWITDDGCTNGNQSFIKYLEGQFNRFEGVFKKYLSKEEIELIKEKEQNIINYTIDKNLKPQLIWYDLNPENILINEENKLSCIVDPGGAQYAIKELDLAFIKMEVCRNEEEFKSVVSEYKKLDNTLDENLIDMMAILVELDDIMLRLQEGIYIPIPYCSNFRKLIVKIMEK